MNNNIQELLQSGFKEDTRAWPDNESKNGTKIFIKGRIVLLVNDDELIDKVFISSNDLKNSVEVSIKSYKDINTLDITLNGPLYVESREFKYSPPTKEEIMGWFTNY